MKALTDRPVERLVFTLRFFTRLPIPGNTGHEGDLAKNAIWFPLAGLVVGLITGIVWWAGMQFFPPMVAAGLALAAGLLVTGALHEDGFADCADGLGGGFTRERALEIMRDSRIGAYGTIALIVSIGLRWAALASLAVWSGLLALLLAHAVSRAVIALPIATSRYARKEGLGTTVSSGVDQTTMLIVCAIAALIGLLLAGFAGLFAVFLAFVAGWLFLKRLEARLGGYTGDGLGAIQQIAEITVLIILAGFAA